MAETYVMDSFALIAHFEDEPGGERVREILRKGKEGDTEVYLSIINWGEVYYQTYRGRGDQKAEEKLWPPGRNDDHRLLSLILKGRNFVKSNYDSEDNSPQLL